MKHLHLVALTALTSALLSMAQPAAPRYVIMMIGDGMGWPHIQLAEYFRGACTGAVRLPLHMTSLPAVGIVHTHSADHLITDSGAGGTALACGIKTANGFIAMCTNHAKYASLAALAQRHGRKAGIVTTDSLVGATPAVFYGHRPDRTLAFPLAVDLFRSGIDLCVAASTFEDPLGLAIPTNMLCALTNELASLVLTGNPATNATGVTWRDAHSLTADYGYSWIASSEDWLAAQPGPYKRIAVLDIPHAIDAPTGALTLAAVTAKSIQLLDNPTGFFLMVEGARIDKLSHLNDAAAVVRETLAFDEAVAAAWDFFTNHPDETLLIVTADHETGGMTVGQHGNQFALLARQRGRAALFQSAFETYRASHSLRSLPARWFSTLIGGPDAGKRAASFDHMKPLLRDHFGFDDAENGLTLAPHEWRLLQRAFELSMEGGPLNPEDDLVFSSYRGHDPVTIAATHILNAHAGVRWTTMDHSSADVAVFAAGPGSALFNGIHDNTDIPRIIMTIMLPGQPFPVRLE